jgi:murein tripeptide amidase MpaA
MKAVAIFALLVCLTLARVRFDGHKVIRANITSLSQYEQFHEHDFDIWSHQQHLIDVRIAPDQWELLKAIGVEYEVIIPDVQYLIDQEDQYTANLKPDASFFDNYQKYEAIVDYLKTLAVTYPDLTTYVASIGKTIQGRDIPAIRIGTKPTTNKPQLFVSGGQHAREWISPATVLYIVTDLLETFRTNQRVNAIMTQYEIIVVPLVNPDGYAFTSATGGNRLWRKNRRLNTGGSYGVDLNRNWDEKWGGDGSSRTPTSDTYCGTAPFSEPETTAVSNYLLLNARNIKGAIDYHSYSQLILSPYGDTRANPPNVVDLKANGDGIARAILAVHNIRYTSQPSIDLYPTTGTAEG